LELFEGLIFEDNQSYMSVLIFIFHIEVITGIGIRRISKQCL